MADSTDQATLTIDQLAERVDMSVRTLRFYASRSLMPPPRRHGRVGYYGPDHIARLELVRELQAHGFTLSAIEGYLARIPADATSEDVALFRTILAPWSSDLPDQVSRAELSARAGREVEDDDLELLIALGTVEPTPEDDVFRVAPSHLTLGLELLDLGLPIEAAQAAQNAFERHGRELAEEVTQIFTTQVLPRHREGGVDAATLQRLVERYKPLSVQAIVVAYESAANDLQRDAIRKRT